MIKKPYLAAVPLTTCLCSSASTQTPNILQEIIRIVSSLSFHQDGGTSTALHSAPQLTRILAAWLQIWLPKHKTDVTSLLFTQKNSKKLVILYKRLVFIFINFKQVFTNMISCMIILSKCSDLGLFLGSVQVYSGRHVVYMDLQPLSLKSDRKEGGIQGTET